MCRDSTTAQVWQRWATVGVLVPQALRLNAAAMAMRASVLRMNASLAR